MSQPTYDDVNLILKLYELRRESKMREARGWFAANFKCKTLAEFSQLCPPGSETNAHYRQATSYWDMCASFVNTGVLNAELFFMNNREMLLCWVRMKPMISEIRAAFSDPNYLGNLEKAANAFAEWLNKTSGAGAYEAFVKRVGG
jgi:hypothetical protein